MSDTGKSKKKSGGMIGWIAALVVLALLSALVPGTVAVIVIGILPTFATSLGDMHGDRRATLAVGIPNIAGILPVLLSLWHVHGGGSIAAAMNLMQQPVTWLLLYGGAGIGTLIYTLLPRAISQFAVSRAESGIEARRGYQRLLERTWGTTVRAEKKEK